MKIRSLRLEHFRKFTDPVVLAGFSDGVNVLAEGNEFGKSTLLAAIRGVLFERHVSKGLSVRQMQHNTNRTSPVISLEFELPSGLHRIEKRFLHRESYAKLTLPNGVMHQNDAAEDHLQRVLNFTAAGTTGSKPENVGMWAALWVQQRDSADQPELADSARHTIHGCLDQEVGALAGGTRGKKLIASVCGELTKIRDGNKKPTGRHKEAVAELAASRAALALLQGKLTRLVKDIEELESVKRTLADMGESSEEAKTVDLLNKARQDRESAQRYEEQLKTAIATHKLHEKDLSSAAKEVETRRVQDESILKTTSRVQALTEAEAARMVELRLAEAALNQQRELVKSSVTVLDRAVESLQQARNMAGLALVSANLLTYRSRLVLAEASQSRVNLLNARLSSLSITEADVARIREIDTKVRRTDAVLEAQATQIEIRLLPQTTGLVRVNGEPFATASQSLIDDTSISIEGVGEIIVTPGIQDRAALLTRRELQRRELREALQAVSAGSVERAEQTCAARKQCEANLANARQELAGHTPADLA